MSVNVPAWVSSIAATASFVLSLRIPLAVVTEPALWAKVYCTVLVLRYRVFSFHEDRIDKPRTGL